MTTDVSNPLRVASVREAVEDALSARSTTATRWFLFAGGVVRAEADPAVASVLDPFAHLEIDESPSRALSIGVAVQPAESAKWGFDSGCENGEFLVSDRGDVVIHARSFAVEVLDRENGRLLAAIADPRSFPAADRAKPMSSLLSIWTNDRGVDVVHAGLVSQNGRGLLIGGAGGSGKSTVALAFAAGGFDYLGDDAIGIRVDADSVSGYSLYGHACLEPQHLGRFSPWPLRDVADPGDGDKSVIRMNELGSARMGRTTNIVAIVLPRVRNDGRTTVSPATARDALFSLAPSSVIRRVVPASRTLRRIGELVGRIPAFRLDMGPNLAEIAPAMQSLLDRGAP